MNEDNNLYAQLAERVRQGDSEASTELSRQLEPQMVHMVRRALRHRTGNSPLERWAIQEANQLARNRRIYSTEVAEWLTSQVARNMCARFIDSLETGSTSATVWDTVRC